MVLEEVSWWGDPLLSRLSVQVGGQIVATGGGGIQGYHGCLATESSRVLCRK